MRYTILVTLLAGCGQIHNADSPDASAPKPDATVPNAPPQACDPFAPFGAPTPIAELNTASNENNLRFSPDQLTGYFSSDRGGSQDIYAVSRASLHDAFGTPILAAGLDTTASETTPTTTADGLTIYFDSNRPDSPGGTDIYTSVRTTPAAAWSTPALVANVTNATSGDGGPYVSPDGMHLFFSSAAQLFVADRGADGTFDPPRALPDLDVIASQTKPVVTPDLLTIYFRGCATDCDVYVGHRASTSDGFGEPSLVAEVSQPTAIDLPTWISPDGCELYLASNRAGGAGGQDIYVASKR